MNLKEYLEFTDSVAVYSNGSGDKERDRAYLGLGIAGEAGEVADAIKKEMRDGLSRRLEVGLELGDVLWYWVRLVKTYGFTPDEVMALNMSKLTERKAKDQVKTHE
jgi:NTP pyrophosphatase (non-canonical NTP hydrolase)